LAQWRKTDRMITDVSLNFVSLFGLCSRKKSSCRSWKLRV